MGLSRSIITPGILACVIIPYVYIFQRSGVRYTWNNAKSFSVLSKFVNSVNIMVKVNDEDYEVWNLEKGRFM